MAVRPDNVFPIRTAAQRGGPLANRRIALFSGNYNCVRDGANNALNRLVAHLLGQKARVRVYSPTARDPAFAPVGDLVSIPSVPIPGRREFRLGLGLPRSVRADLDRFAPDLIHLSAPDISGFAALAYARAAEIPVVASMHTRFETYFDYYGLGSAREWAWRRLARFYGRSDHVLVPNDPCADCVSSMGVSRARISIWGRGVDPADFGPHQRDMAWRRAMGYADDEPVLLFFGRLVFEKGIDKFAETVAELRRRGRWLRPLVVGEGPAGGWMREQLGEALFLGHLEGEARGCAVASADLLVNPSLTEAFGNVTLEAMASGLAVVSADVESARALLCDRVTGRLVEPTAVALANAFEALADDPPSLKAVRAAAARHAATFRWDDVLNPVVATYDRLLRSSLRHRAFIDA